MSDDRPGIRPRIEPSGPVPDAVQRILRSLPEWFGIDEANAAYIEAARKLPSYVARIPSPSPNEGASDRRTDGAPSGTPSDDDTEIVGVCLVEQHSEHSSEIHLLAVEREHRGMGIGRALMERVEQDLARQGKEFLQVKTLGASHPSPEYAATRYFYEALGYRALQELPADELWPGNPCLIMIKALRPHSPTA